MEVVGNEDDHVYENPALDKEDELLNTEKKPKPSDEIEMENVSTPNVTEYPGVDSTSVAISDYSKTNDEEKKMTFVFRIFFHGESHLDSGQSSAVDMTNSLLYGCQWSDKIVMTVHCSQ